MKTIYKKYYKNYYDIIEKYYLIAGQAVFMQRIYKLKGEIVKTFICQVVKSIDEIPELFKSVEFNRGVLWFNDIKRPAVSSFKVVEVNDNAPMLSFKLDPVIFTILEVLYNESRQSN